MRTFIVLSIFFLLTSCGVKEAPKGTANPQTVAGNTPIEGVFLTAEKKYLVRPSRVDFAVAPQWQVTYQIVDQDLEPLKTDVSLKVKYLMPSMPQMPVTPAKIERVAQSKFVVTYDISMEGGWEFILSIEDSSKSYDTLKFAFEVPAQ